MNNTQYWRLTGEQRAMVARHVAGGMTAEQAVQTIVPALAGRDIRAQHGGLVLIFPPARATLAFGERVPPRNGTGDGYVPVRRFASRRAKQGVARLIERARRERVA